MATELYPNLTNANDGEPKYSGDVVDDTDTKKIDLSDNESEDDETERGYWGGKLDFILSCIGYAVGLGNLWRFPYLCMRNGGGAFLIPYFFFLFLCGIPLFFMELSLGQFTSLSPLEIWNVAPIFKGLGWGMIIVSGLLCIYYNVIITWVLYYLTWAFISIPDGEVMWNRCDNEWNNETLCITTPPNKTLICLNETHLIPDITSEMQQFISNLNTSSIKTNQTCANFTPASTDPSDEFWHNNILSMSDGIDDVRGVKWQLFICLVVAWIIVFLCLCKGVKSSGKVVYVTATVPYIFLTILLIRGLTLPGAGKGIYFYIVPDFSRLLQPKVWCEACLQIFYSLGPAWGGLITMASYNKFHNNCYRDALIVPLVNCGTSFYGGFVIFSIIGHMAYIQGKDVDKVITEGPGLAFVAYPAALGKLPISPLWAILFFLMLLTLGLDSQFGTFETVISSFVDEWPKFLRRRKMLFTIFMCFVELLLGLIYVSYSGMFWFQVTDWYCAAFSVVTIAFFECIVISWLYGADRLYDEIEMMVHKRPVFWWKICWKFITPTLLLIILVFSLATNKPPRYGKWYDYPSWAVGFGWVLASLSILPFPVYAVYRFCITEGSFKERIAYLTKPTESWGPALPKHRVNYSSLLGLNKASPSVEMQEVNSNKADNYSENPSNYDEVQPLNKPWSLY